MVAVRMGPKLPFVRGGVKWSESAPQSSAGVGAGRTAHCSAPRARYSRAGTVVAFQREVAMNLEITYCVQ